MEFYLPIINIAENYKVPLKMVGGKWYDAPDCAVAFDWTWVYGPIRYKAQVSIQESMVQRLKAAVSLGQIPDR